MHNQSVATGREHPTESLTGGGEMGRRTRAYDWAQTPLGPIDTWSHSLRTAVAIMINSRSPMLVWWGPRLTTLYNDACIPILGARHPAALGDDAASVWADIWDVLGPRADIVVREGRATWHEDLLLRVERNQIAEEPYFTWSYSPVADDDGAIKGVCCAVMAQASKVSEASLVATAILRKERGALVAIEAIEAQRRQISRELHDELGQELTALVLGLKSARDAVPANAPVHAHLQRLQAMATQMSQDVHHIALELRPGALDEQGLQTALTNYIEEWSTRHGVGAEFQHVGLDHDRLPAHLETTIYRIVQEALTNVSKHAKATHVSVILQRDVHDVVAIVEDNGCGFDVTSADLSAGKDRLGLLGMKERTTLVGGACHVESQAGSTTVFARIPVSRDEISRA